MFVYIFPFPTKNSAKLNTDFCKKKRHPNASVFINIKNNKANIVEPMRYI